MKSQRYVAVTCAFGQMHEETCRGDSFYSNDLF